MKMREKGKKMEQTEREREKENRQIVKVRTDRARER